VRHEMSAGCVGVLAGAAFGSPGRRPGARWREGSGVVMVSDGLVRRWEAVYREYGTASAMVSASEPGDRDVAARMARASRNVATVWREMAGESDVDWWAVAALSAAAQAFEYQERDWSARAKLDSPVVAGPVRRVHPAVAGGRHALGGVADVG
jgi:hypothetical protein